MDSIPGYILRVDEGEPAGLLSLQEDEETRAVTHAEHAALVRSHELGEGLEEADAPYSEGSEGGDEGLGLGYTDVGPASATEVIYVREGVAVWPSRAKHIPGRLSLVKQHCVVFLTWLPYSHGTLLEDGTFTVDAAPSPRSSRSAGHTDTSGYAIMPIPLSDIRSLTPHTPRFGSHSVAITLITGVTLPPFHFSHKGGVTALVEVLKQHTSLIRSTEQPGTLLVNDVADPLPRTLTPLTCEDILLGGPPGGLAAATFAPPPPSHLTPATGVASSSTAAGAMGASGSWDAWAEHADSVWDASGTVTGVGAGAGGSSVAAPRASGPSGWSRLFSTVESLVVRLAQEFAPGPGDGASSSAMDPGSLASQQWLAAVGLAWDSFEPADSAASGSSAGAGAGSAQAATTADPEAGAAGTSSAVAGAGASEDDQGPPAAADAAGTEAEEGSGSGAAAAAAAGDDYELIEVGGEDDMGGRLVAQSPPQPPLTEEEWAAMHDAEGRLVSLPALAARAFASGLCGDVRRDAWRYLLGLHVPGSTPDQRKAAVAQRRARYQGLLKQWQSMSTAQAARFSSWRERVSRVEKDVRRTDRTQPLYAAEGGPASKALTRMLLSYAMYDFDMGYCQGMSDMAAPLLGVLRDESEAFWGFAALMERMGANFQEDQQAMHAQLVALRGLLQLVDPQLYAHLEQADALTCIWAFRWLLIHFKRELPYEGVLRLWEAAWSYPATPHLHLYLAAAVLVHHRRAIMATVQDMDGMMRWAVGMSGQLEVTSLLRLASQLCARAGAAGADVCAGLRVRCQGPVALQ